MKKLFIALTGMFICAGIFASEEKIELPQVTTEVSGDKITAGKEAVPDYRKIIPQYDVKNFSLPDAGVMEEQKIPSEEEKILAGRKSVYVDGKIGAGYRLDFLADMSIKAPSENSPFSLNFYHDGGDGFTGGKGEEGFFESFTKVHAVKEFSSENSRNKISGLFETENNGFQMMSKAFTEKKSHYAQGNWQYDRFFSNGTFLKIYGDGDYYSRNGVKNGSTSSLKLWEESASLLDFNPAFTFGLKRSKMIFSLKGDYKGSLNLTESFSSKATHRGEIILAYDLLESGYSIHADVAAAAGNALGENPVIVPFNLGFSFDRIAGKTGQIVSGYIYGGCKSENNTVSKIEKIYPFTACSFIPGETSDWYVKTGASFGFNNAAFGAECEFLTTAYKNGVYRPVYTDDFFCNSGYYSAVQENRREFNTNVSASFSTDLVRMNFLWNAFWLDVPVLEEKFSIQGNVEFGRKNSKWLCALSIKQNLAKNADFVPEISGGGEIKMNSSFRLSLSAKDAVKLFSNTGRKISSSKYVKKSGGIYLLLKFTL